MELDATADVSGRHDLNPHQIEGAANDRAANDRDANDPATLDLDAIEADLADVEVALARLEAATYWTCEITGHPLSDELLSSRPTTRRLPT